MNENLLYLFRRVLPNADARVDKRERRASVAASISDEDADCGGGGRVAKTQFELAIEASTGEKIEILRSQPLDERRRAIEKKLGRRLRFTSRYPFIGRGSVLHGCTLSRDEVDAKVDEALG